MPGNAEASEEVRSVSHRPAASFDFAQDELYCAWMHFFVYILRCANGAYYVGSHRGDDVMNRVHAHNEGLDPKAYTFRRRPVELVWSEDFEDPEDMVAAERRLKGWSRAKKEAYIRGDLETLKSLAKSKTAPADPTKSKFFKLTGTKRPRSS